MLKRIVGLSLLCLSATVQAAELTAAPACGDQRTVRVLSHAFARQGEATGVNMRVRDMRSIRETAHYPDKKIRQCSATVSTEGGDYTADYTIVVQGEQFFVQAENVLPVRR